MTGTSLDGLDAALVRIHGDGLGMRAEFIRAISRPLSSAPDGVGALLADLSRQEPFTAQEISNLSRTFSTFHAEVVADLLRLAGIPGADLICVHGQTVFHSPPSSWQLFNPFPLAHALRTPVVFDLRGADLAAGGQGAPMTPLADWVLFRRPKPVTVVNLGGYCNITQLPRADGEGGIDGIQARDVCACNQVLDGVAREVLGRDFDADGQAAAQGTVHAAACDDLKHALLLQSRAKRSLGTGDEAVAWVNRWRERVNANDLARCAVEGVAHTIAAACAGTSALLLAGGGVKNRTLVSRLQELHSGDVQTTDSAGVPTDYREAVCMAVLGALCQDRVAITLPQVTGVASPAPVAGCWAGGHAP